ncbi:MAG: macro domain-containing protein [Alphaproteobacteria bacterium]|nr:macro domain-containing protein [Alphaproteobacteria bacterium]
MAKVTVKIGDLFESDAQTLVNTVNCVGIMGKGIAYEFKRRFPEMFKDYVELCERNEVQLGKPYLYKELFDKWVINFPTKDHWRSVSRLEDINQGFEYLKYHYKRWGITSVAVPPLGCGMGQLDWDVVGPTLYRHLSELEIPVELYAPFGTPKSQLMSDFLGRHTLNLSACSGIDPNSKITPGMVALVGVLSRIHRERFHWPIGRVAFQKMAYFARVSGIPIDLEFKRASYGPFAPNLKKVTGQLMNNNLVREYRYGRMFRIVPGPTYADARELSKPFLIEWRHEVERVADLFLRLRSTRDIELAATVHFAATELICEQPSDADENAVLMQVKEWKAKRSTSFSDIEISKAIRNLNLLGWIDIKPSDLLPVPQDEILYA